MNSARPRFFARSAWLMLAIVVLSFPLTYYLPVATRSREFDLLHHVHGAVLFAWMVVHALQAQWAAQGRMARHREWGLLGLLLTGAVLPLGYWMAQRAALARVGTMDRPYEGTWFNLVDMSLFALLMVAAMVLVTRHKEWHRRFVFVAALCLMAPAASRWTMRLPGLDPMALDLAVYALTYPFLIALARWDWRSTGRIHPATWVSAALLLPFHFSAPWMARSGWWAAVAPGWVGLP